LARKNAFGFFFAASKQPSSVLPVASHLASRFPSLVGHIRHHFGFFNLFILGLVVRGLCVFIAAYALSHHLPLVT
jgi:hypothetical protein